MKRNIALIGFMGTGKSEIGKKLAKELGKKYVSTDSLVERRVRKPILKIFEDEGEEKFRELESEVIKDISEENNLIIDGGGGIILNEENIENLRKNSIIIRLTASPEVILNRISKEKKKRPLLGVPDRLEKIKELMSLREKFYEKVADYCIDTSDLSVGELAEKILRMLKSKEITEIIAPPSKSYTNRALIIAALANGKSTLKNPSDCEDSCYLIKALKEFGVKIEKEKDGSLIVHGTGGEIKTPRRKEIFVGNSGTAMRFLTTFATLAKGKVTIKGNKRMNERPIQDLIDSLRESGVKIYSKSGNGCPPVVVHGGNFLGGKIKLKAKKSSQYLSSVLMCAPYAKRRTEIEIDDGLTSKPYVDMTISLMKKFNVRVVNDKYKKFIINSNRKYKAREIAVEGDTSNASYFFALAAIAKKKIRVRGINPQSSQGDIHFVDILEKMGCEVKKGKNWIEVEGREKNLRGITIDMNEMPDVVQTLAIVALFAKGKTKIVNVANLRIKETDRIMAVAKELKKMGAKVEELEDGLIIEPRKLKKKAEIETYNDHRMAMSFGILSLINPGIKIKNSDCVKKSYPEFWEVIEKRREKK